MNLCAFSLAPPLPFLSPRVTRQCTCMKARKSSKNKRTPRSKSAITPPVTKRNSSNSAPSVSKSASNSAPETDDSSESMEFETASGAAGDATPHRANVPKPFSALQNPEEDDSLDAPLAPLVALPNLSNDEISALQFDRRTELDVLIEYFADASRTDNFTSIIVANRHLVTEHLLYRFTSAILQVESRTNNIETKLEEAKNMRQLRKELIATCWSIDYPLKAEVQRAEARLLNVLQGANIRKDVERNCGKSTLQVDSFWIVIFAAVAAWEERGRENPQLVNVDMQKSLAAAAEACRDLKVVNKYLSASLKAVQQILASADPAVQTNVVAEMTDDIMNDLCAFAEKIRLLPTPAYGALVSRMRAIIDYALKEKYDIDPQFLEPFRFELPDVERKSKLVQFAKTSTSLKRQ